LPTGGLTARAEIPGAKGAAKGVEKKKRKSWPSLSLNVTGEAKQKRRAKGEADCKKTHGMDARR